MVAPSTGSVVLVPFPFSDLSQAKLRPAVVLASGNRNDWVLCQVTSKPYGDRRALELCDSDFVAGGRTALGVRTGFRVEANDPQPDGVGLEFHPSRPDGAGTDARENGRSVQMLRGDGDVPLPCGPYGASLFRRRSLHLQGRNGVLTMRRCRGASCVGDLKAPQPSLRQ